MPQLSKSTAGKIGRELIPYSGDQKQIMAIKIIAKNFYYYCERNLCIKDKNTGQIVPFELNWAQAKFVEMVLEDLKNNKPVRYIILKARQMGISTVIEALGYWWVATRPNINAAIVAHEKPAAVNLYKMFRRFYENSHESFQPSLKYNTKNDLTFDVEDNIKKRAIEEGQPVPGLGSEILTMVAKDDAGRSGTNHFVHGSECAMWEDSADVVSSLIQTVPLAPETFIFLESTAKGIGNFFFSEWMSATRGESQFKPFFLAWHDHSEYELDRSFGKAPYNDRELKLIHGDPTMSEGDPYSFKAKGYTQNIVERKIAWRRRKLKEFARDPQKFDQEYPDSPMVAFLATGTYAFSIGVLLSMQDRAKKYPAPFFARFRAPKLNETFVRDNVTIMYSPKDVVMDEVESSDIRIWKKPVPGRKYVVGADVAEGIEVSSATGKEGDYSVADVMDAKTLETVAKYRGHIDPDLFGKLLFDLGTYYNKALMGVEVNNHGLVTVQYLKNHFYRNMYQRERTPEEQEFEDTRTTLLGWLTNRKTKPLMISNLASAIREEVIIDHDLVFIGEAMVYTSNDKGVYGGKDGGHDDCIMAKAVALQMADWLVKDVTLAKENMNKTNTKLSNNGTRFNAESGISNSSRSSIIAKRRGARARSASRRG